MFKRAFWFFGLAMFLWGAASLAAGWWLLPGMLLNPPVPVRTETSRRQVLAELELPGTQVDCSRIPGGQGRALELIRLRRPASRGLVVYLHGFGDDLWGTLGRAKALPDWDAVGFTFRGRDRDPAVPCTLGGWERQDVVAVVHHLLGSGVPAEQIILAGWSMGAGIALLALEDLERAGIWVGGALLECPFEDLAQAARDHIRGTLGPAEPMLRWAEHLALKRAGRLAGFDPFRVSPVQAAGRIRTRVALVTGDADTVTPPEGVRRMARRHADLTVVAGAGHCEASNRLPGGWEGWARVRLDAWGY